MNEKIDAGKLLEFITDSKFSQFIEDAMSVSYNFGKTKKIIVNTDNVYSKNIILTVPDANSILTTIIKNGNLCTGYTDYTVMGFDNTVYGVLAGTSLVGGFSNTAIGKSALLNNISGSHNTCIGAQTLLYNLGSNNTAIGYSALFSNTTGNNNIAIGPLCMNLLTTGINNIGMGYSSLNSMVSGSGNIGIGILTLSSIINSTNNIAIGNSSMKLHKSGDNNICLGTSCLASSVKTVNNVCIGTESLMYLTTGFNNTCLGHNTGSKISIGCNNLILGYNANTQECTDSNSIVIGAQTLGNGTDSITIGNEFIKTCYIRGIRGSNTNIEDGIPVLIDSNSQLGTLSSSRKYKQNITHISDNLINDLYKLEPVSFYYKSNNTKLTYGLIAEDVHNIVPDIVVYKNEQPETVQYHLLSILLLGMVKNLKKEIDILKNK